MSLLFAAHISRKLSAKETSRSQIRPSNCFVFGPVNLVITLCTKLFDALFYPVLNGTIVAWEIVARRQLPAVENEFEPTGPFFTCSI